MSSFSHVYVSSSVNFKEPEAVRALTCTLLKEDFGLTIEIPLERLIPTVPLRLNYIHWVEDLIDGQKQPRRGIDIGTTTTTICVICCVILQFVGWVSASSRCGGDSFHVTEGFPEVFSSGLNDFLRNSQSPLTQGFTFSFLLCWSNRSTCWQGCKTET